MTLGGGLKIARFGAVYSVVPASTCSSLSVAAAAAAAPSLTPRRPPGDPGSGCWSGSEGRAARASSN